MGLTNRNNPQSFEELAANEEKEEVKEVEATETTDEVTEPTDEQEPQTDAPVETTE